MTAMLEPRAPGGSPDSLPPGQGGVSILLSRTLAQYMQKGWSCWALRWLVEGIGLQ